MRIAFDLDDTLLPLRARFATEPPRVWPWRWFVHDALREGAVELLRALQRAGWDVWVYTSSFRSPAAVRVLFRAYGVRLGGVVNADLHARTTGGRERYLKHPPSFGVDLLVDDSHAVADEGARVGYRVVLVAGDDVGWAGRVMRAAERVRAEIARG